MLLQTYKFSFSILSSIRTHRSTFCCRKDCSVGEDAEKTSLVDSTLLPKIQPSTLPVDQKTNLIANGDGAIPNGDPENGRTPQGSAVRQVLAALVAQLGTINTGMTFGFSAIALPQLQEPDSIIPIEEGSTEESWIGTYF